MESPGFRHANGKVPACEPCKQRKVACGHERPICTRCIKRKQESSCVYLDHETPRSPRPRRRRTAGIPFLSSSSSGVAPSPTSKSTSPGPAATASAGYLGFTSFSAVFQEAGMIPGGLPTEPTPSDPQGLEGYPSPADITSARVREQCLSVLQRVPDRDRAAYLLRKRAGPMDGWIKFIAEHLVESLYETFGHYLGRNRSPSQLQALAQQLCTNTSASFSDDESDPRKWMAQFSGQNMRWESIGILICFWDEDSPCSRSDVDGWAWTERETLELCLELCKRLSRGNSLMVYLHYRLMIAETLFSGDASLASWRLHGEVVTLLTFLGFHAEASNPEYKPTITSEIKRKMCAIVYIFSTVCASFTGRPPLLSSHYMNGQLPLDFAEDDLSLGQAALQEKVDGLDAHGWNQDGEVYSSTFIRAWALLCFVREEILQIAIGKGAGSQASQTLQLLRTRELETVAQFPKSLHHDHGDLVNLNVDVIKLYRRLGLRLEHLQNLFFIERLLLRHGQPDNGDLLAVSIDMVTYTLYSWTHLDRLLAVRRDCEWLVMSFAAPASGILCTELLNPRPGILEKIGTSRSKIVQKLSLLVGYLDWVNPSGPNGKLCQNCKALIENVLDQAIDFDPSAAMPFHFDMSADLNFNFDLLDTFDWVRSEPS